MKTSFLTSWGLFWGLALTFPSTTLWTRVLVASCLYSMSMSWDLLNVFYLSYFVFPRVFMIPSLASLQYIQSDVIGIWQLRGLQIMQSSQRMGCCFAAKSKNFAIKRCVMSHGGLLPVDNANRDLCMPPLGREQSWDFQLILSIQIILYIFFFLDLGIFYLLIIFIMLYSQGAKFHILLLLCKQFFLYLELGMHSMEAQLIDHTMAKCTRIFLLVWE